MVRTPREHMDELALAGAILPAEALDALRRFSPNYGSPGCQFDARLYSAYPETADQLMEIETMSMLHRWAEWGGMDALCRLGRAAEGRQKALFGTVRDMAGRVQAYLIAHNIVRKACKDDPSEGPDAGLADDAPLKAMAACSQYLIRQPWTDNDHGTVYTGWFNMIHAISFRSTSGCGIRMRRISCWAPASWRAGSPCRICLPVSHNW